MPKRQKSLHNYITITIDLLQKGWLNQSQQALCLEKLINLENKFISIIRLKVMSGAILALKIFLYTKQC